MAQSAEYADRFAAQTGYGARFVDVSGEDSGKGKGRKNLTTNHTNRHEWPVDTSLISSNETRLISTDMIRLIVSVATRLVAIIETGRSRLSRLAGSSGLVWNGLPSGFAMRLSYGSFDHKIVGNAEIFAGKVNREAVGLARTPFIFGIQLNGIGLHGQVGTVVYRNQRAGPINIFR